MLCDPLQVISVLSMLVVMSWAIFLVRPDTINDRAQMTYTLFLAGVGKLCSWLLSFGMDNPSNRLLLLDVAFHFVVGESIPPVRLHLVEAFNSFPSPYFVRFPT